MAYSEIVWRECVRTALREMVKEFGLEGSIASAFTFLIGEIDKPQYMDSVKHTVEEMRNFYGAYGLEL